MTTGVVVFSDLHIGNMFDFYAYYEILALAEKVMKRHKVNKTLLVMLGDVCDASEIYRTQLTLAENRLQRYIAADIIDETAKRLKAYKILVLAGNHDLRKGIELARDVARILIDEYGYNVDYSENLIVEEVEGVRFLFTHTMSRRSRGSYFGGLTGYILTKILYVMVKTKADVAVLGHTHKGGAWQDVVYQCSSFHIESLDINDRTMWSFVVNNGKIFPERLYVTGRLYTTNYQMEITKFYIERLLKIRKVDRSQVQLESIVDLS